MKGRNHGFYRQVAALARVARGYGFAWRVDGSYFAWARDMRNGITRGCPLRYARAEMERTRADWLW